MPTFPFSAIVGQDEMRQALLIAAVDPAVGGVLVFGDRGTGKSTAIRALAALLPPMAAVVGCPYNCDPASPADLCPHCAQGGPRKSHKKPVPVVDLPLGATEDRVVGTLDLERALGAGVKAFEPGLLARANRGFLYIDEVNLLEDHLVDLLLDVNFPAEVATAVAARGIDPSQLVFEVTEGTMLSDLARAQEAAGSLRALGSEISLDDYGTGYASLAYLRKFPLDELKLDRSFVADLDSDAVARTFVQSAVDVAHALGIRVVAEGIETQEIWDAVRNAGGDVCQGYFFNRPLSSEAFLEQIVRPQAAALRANG